MGGSPENQENEIKLRIPSAAEGRRLLRRAGFRITRRRTFEDNVVFDTAERSLRRADSLLRVRAAGKQATLTYKGPGQAGPHKLREEVETAVGDPAALRILLERLGFHPVFRYQKYRTEYSLDGQGGLATLDEMPIGSFLELEGPPAWVDKTAARLGFSGRDYITSSYGRLYLDYCREQNLPPGDMVFPILKTMPSGRCTQ